jgi:hypothetical protein
MPIAAISSCISAATIVFLIVSAWRNRRAGYRRPLRVSLLAEGLAWLAEIRDSLNEQPERAVASPQASAPAATPLRDMTFLSNNWFA